jgi:hypothetical protein
MRPLFIFSIFFFITACGNDKMVSNRSQSSNGVAQSSGLLSIPAPGMLGGGPILTYNNTRLHMGTLSNQASGQLSALMNGQTNIAPISRDYTSIIYRVHFSGLPTQGPCSTNPMAQCSVINLESLSAY